MSTHSPDSVPTPSSEGIVQLSSSKFVLGCLLAAFAVLLAGPYITIPTEVLAGEVFLTIIALFVFGSIKYQVHKNALTYGCGLVILCTFMAKLGPAEALSELRAEFPTVHGVADLFHLHTALGLFEGVDHLIHIDTMLFILGLTFFVSVIAQTRLLETITFVLLRLNKGFVLPTVLCVTAVVAAASGILDGVSMIGLTIRTLVIILALAAAPAKSIRYAVMVCTVVTTVCGMWLAYGEPPNLIMKANVIHHVDGAKVYLLHDSFFLRWCLPAAIISFLCVAWSLRRQLTGLRVELNKLDVVEANAATVRFLQAEKHGEVFSAVEFAHEFKDTLASHFDGVLGRIEMGEALGLAMVNENVPRAKRVELLGHYTSEELACVLDEHYVLESKGQSPGIDAGEAAAAKAFTKERKRCVVAQRFGIAALVPFVGLLITHALNHELPLFFASIAGFAVAIVGVWGLPKMRKLALHEAAHEYSEYYFLFPLFLSISLLTKVNFFDELANLLQHGMKVMGNSSIALIQFYGATFLSALLDNNVVADFASRAIRDLPELTVIYLFAMAQIAGYAAGGCWTHIGSAQSVVAFAFIKRDVDARFTPAQWIKQMTPLLLLILVGLTAWILVQGLLVG
ncbi:MAG: hypothetical protein GC164_12200 [Phycisphaera sp.]|nr:hypothetical protein [Phycisphaera sp.]